jgi:hypothetical protein
VEAWFSDQTYTCLDNMPMQVASNYFEERYIWSEICCIKSLPIIMTAQPLGYSEMNIISVSNTNYNLLTPVSQDGITLLVTRVQAGQLRK